MFQAPFDVRFPKASIADKDIYTVLQPDICVICDPAKLDEHGCIGAPDIVAEILSPGNNQKELLQKYQIYQEFGVKEYWIISGVERESICPPGYSLLVKRSILRSFQALNWISMKFLGINDNEPV